MIINKGLRVACVIAGIGALHAETPDFLADALTGDGVGYVDTGYAYKAGVTSKVTCDLHIEKRGMGDREVPAAKSVARGLFGFWKSPCISAFRFNGTGAVNNDDLQCWGQGGDCQPTKSYNSQNDLVLAVDYVAGKCAWDGTTFSTDIAAPTSNSTLTYWLFSINGNGSPTPFALRSMKIYENGAATPVCDLKPCFAKGRAALYDAAAEKILYPTSDGFTLSGYDISLELGKTLAVNAASCAPRTLSLASGGEMAFDGVHTLHSDVAAVLPSSGTVKVSQTTATGKGRYVLIDSLPTDYSLATFVLGSVPVGFSGVLSKDGSKLILTLSAEGLFPEAMAAILKGDSIGHVDTEYSYRHQKTSRIVFDCVSTDRYMDGRSGSNVSRAIFGFNKSGSASSWLRIRGNGSKEYDNISYSYGELVTKAAKDVAGNFLGDCRVVVDYAKGKVSFDGGMTLFDAPAPAMDASVSLWMFDINSLSNPAPVEFREMRIYENGDDPGTEVLVHDFVPAVQGGVPVVYDQVTKTIKTPSTDRFEASDLSYRLSVNGEVVYATGTVSVDCSEPENVDGWVVLSDADDSIVESGAGTTATFDMPESPVRVVWTKDAVVASGARLVVDATACYNDLTLEAGATLVFREGGKIVVAGDMTTPSPGSASVEFEGQGLPGEYVLATGVQSDLRLSAFRLAVLPMGLSGAVRRDGDSLILALRDDSAGSGGLVAKSLKGDGIGYIDTKYFYDYPRTSKVTFDFSTDDRGMSGRSVGTSTTRAVFGFLNNSGTANGQLSYVRFTGNGTDSSDAFQMWGGNGTYSSKSINARDVSGRLLGDLSLLFDYANGMASYEGGQNPFALNTPVMTSPKSYWIFNVNGQNYPTAFEFKRMCVFETDAGKESLVHDYVPALKDGKAGVCDRLNGSMLYPTTDGFLLDFGVVSQSFYSVSTVSAGMPVSVPAFGVERTFAFVRDGSVTAKLGMSSLTLSRYDASGALLSADQETDVEAGDTFPVALDGAAKLVVTVAGPDYPSEKTVGQSFDPVDFLGVAPATYRRVKKHDYEVALAGAATLTFKTGVSEVWADNYAADGTLIGSEKLSGAFDVGQSLEIPAGTAAWRIVRVAECRPGMILLFR